MFPIGVPEEKLPVAIFPITEVPSWATSSIAIQYIRFPIPEVLLANRLFTHRPGIIVVVSKSTCVVTKVAIRTSPFAGDRLDIDIFDCVPEFGIILRSSTIGGDIGTDVDLLDPS